MEIIRTVNRGTDSNVRYIKKTEKLEQQARVLSAKTSVSKKSTDRVTRTIEARDEALFDKTRLHKENEGLRYENENFAARDKGRREAD